MAKLTNAEALQIVRQNAAIADTAALERRAAKTQKVAPFSLGQAVLANAQRNFAILAPFARDIQAAGTIDDRTAERLKRKWLLSPRPYLVDPESGRRYPNSDIPSRLGREALYTFFVKKITTDPNARKLWAEGVIDQVVSRLSLDTKADIYESGLSRPGILVIGGGLNTPGVLHPLATFFKSTLLVTEDERLGGPWRNRPLRLNSPVALRNSRTFLPLEGLTTPALPAWLGSILPQTDSLNGDTRNKLVRCDDGSIREYPWGPALGEYLASLMPLATPDIATSTRVDFSQILQTSSGLNIPLIDTNTGKKAGVNPRYTFAILGPGRESCKIPDTETKEQYNKSLQYLDDAIARAIATGQPFSLPHSLSWTGIEKIYSYWQQYLKGDPSKNPLLQLRNKTVAFIGGKDTTAVNYELFNDILNLGVNATIYGQVPDNQRRRYESTYNRNVTILREPVRAYKPARSNDVLAPVDVTATSTARFDYTIENTGFTRNELNVPFDLDIIRDIEGNAVAIGNKKLGFFLDGPGSGLPFDAYPQLLKNIVTGLGIGENSISAWLWRVLQSRLVLSFLIQTQGNRK